MSKNTAVKTISRKDIAHALGLSQPTMTDAAAAAAVDDMLSAISANLNAGHRVELRGFGSWKVKETKARTGRNPKTGDPVEIPARKKVTFKYHGPAPK